MPHAELLAARKAAQVAFDKLTNIKIKATHAHDEAVATELKVREKEALLEQAQKGVASSSEGQCPAADSPPTLQGLLGKAFDIEAASKDAELKAGIDGLQAMLTNLMAAINTLKEKAPPPTAKPAAEGGEASSDATMEEPGPNLPTETSDTQGSQELDLKRKMEQESREELERSIKKQATENASNASPPAAAGSGAAPAATA